MRCVVTLKRDWCFVAEQPAPAPHLAHPEEWCDLGIVVVTLPRVSRSCEHLPDGFDLNLLRDIEMVVMQALLVMLKNRRNIRHAYMTEGLRNALGVNKKSTKMVDLHVVVDFCLFVDIHFVVDFYLFVDFHFVVDFNLFVDFHFVVDFHSP